jgi:Homeodomain-like domain
MNVRYRVELSQAERGELAAMLSGGKHAARKLKRAQILLATDAGSSDEEIARAVAVGGSTVYRTKRRFVEGNLERALSEDCRSARERLWRWCNPHRQAGRRLEHPGRQFQPTFAHPTVKATAKSACPPPLDRPVHVHRLPKLRMPGVQNTAFLGHMGVLSPTSTTAPERT